MKYDYNDKKSATATVKMESGAPWTTRQVLLGGTATTPDKDMTGLKGVKAPPKTLNSQVDEAAGVRVTQVINKPVLREAAPTPVFGLPGMGQIYAPPTPRLLAGLPGMGELFQSKNTVLLLIAAAGAAWMLTKGR